MKFSLLVKQINSVQKTLQATAEHAINISLTVRNWLIGYLAYPQIESEIRQTLSGELNGVPAHILLHKLPYSHLLLISSIENNLKRNFYEIESIKGNWSFRELERQVKYALAGLDKNIFVKKYMIELPDEKTIKEYISKEMSDMENYYA